MKTIENAIPFAEKIGKSVFAAAAWIVFHFSRGICFENPLTIFAESCKIIHPYFLVL